ncbi:MAG TPA: LacI family DNA-binding transcriptional regulator [Chthoniobacteraceae bacterium]|nr:LacI family DNA-binding transcriptional regulator [Chthoniobacteraceae bacterium]
MRRTKPTQKDVAKAAEVSQTLVSLVLSGAPVDVAEATRAQILKAARDLGYATKKKRTTPPRQRVLAYIRPVVERGHHEEHWIYDSYDQYYDRIQNYLLEAAYQAGYALIVRPYEKTHELTQWLMEWGVDGVVWHGHGTLAQWIAERYPMVQINRHTVMEADAVSTNQEEMVRVPLNYLRSLGHERILFLERAQATNTLRETRIRIYREYLREHGLLEWEALWRTSGGFEDSLSGTTGLLEKLKSFAATDRNLLPTAILTGDHGALYHMKHLARCGVDIPEQISFVGIDNISASALSHPALTTLDNCLDEMAQTAISLLIERIQHPGSAFKKLFITPRLIVRESVADLKEPAPSSAALSSTPVNPT